MSKQVGTIAASLMNTSLNQKSADDSLDRNNSTKSEFLRQGISQDFPGTNAAEVFQRDFSRRPSYRRLLNDLTSESRPYASVQKVEDDSSDGQVTQDSNDTSDDTAGLGSETSFHSLPSTMTALKSDAALVTSSDILTTSANHETLSSQPNNPYGRPSDGHFFIPVHQLNASRLVTIPQNLMMSSSGINNSATVEEVSRKRQLRLLKNKEAAKECRRKKKEYVKCLENRVAVLENQNKTLIEELKSLKELYCQKDVQS